MNTNFKRAIIDDGCSPHLVHGATFDGIFEFPLIQKPDSIRIPSRIVPFSKRNRIVDRLSAIGFYENDPIFADVLINPEKYVSEFQRYYCFISLDCSLYREAPIAVQIANIYRSRSVGYYYQKQGVYVIPQVRWGSIETYTTKLFPERIAFSGIEKDSIVAIGTYGCIKTKEDKFHFKNGLESMLETLTPKIVLVYGGMPDVIFGDFRDHTQFVHYTDWISEKHGGGQ